MSAARNALGWLRSVLVTNPLICLYTIVMGTISVASSLVDPRGSLSAPLRADLVAHDPGHRPC